MNNERVRQILDGNTAGMGAIPQRTHTKRADTVTLVPVEMFRPDPNNARKDFNADELAALAEDLRRHGQIQNVVAFYDETTGQYELVAGERRWRAAPAAGLKHLMCLIVPRELADDVRAEIAFAENMCRVELKPTEVAAHWRTLMDRWKCSTRELAARVGVSQSTVSKRLALLKLDPDTQRDVDAGTVKRTAAVAATAKRRNRAGTAKRTPRGVFELAAGTVRVRRGHTVAQLAAELAALVAAQADTAPEAQAAA